MLVSTKYFWRVIWLLEVVNFELKREKIEISFVYKEIAKMKKVLFGLLVSVLSLGLLVAEEGEEESSIFSPSASIENEFSINGVRNGEDLSKGNVHPDEEEGALKNKTTAKFGVGIAIMDGFKLKPYVSDAVVVGENATFKNNDFTLGLGGKYEPLEMLGISFDLGYIAQTKLYGKTSIEVPDTANPGQTKTKKVPFFTMQANGIKFGAGVEANIESIFLEMGLDYKFKGMFAKIRVGKDNDDVNRVQSFKNTIALEAKMDFFNFIKEDLNSGLVLSNETTFETKKEINDKAKNKNSKVFESTKEIENEFAIGLHFAPVEFMDFTFLTKVNSKSSKVYVGDEDDKDNFGKYVGFGEDTGSSTAVALGIGLELKKGMFTFGMEYSPTVSERVTFKADKDASAKSENSKNLGQEFKLTFGIEL